MVKVVSALDRAEIKIQSEQGGLDRQLEQKRQLPREGTKLLLWDAFPAVITVDPSRTASGLKKYFSKDAGDYYTVSNFCQMLKLTWLSPFCPAPSILTSPSGLRCGPSCFASVKHLAD